MNDKEPYRATKLWNEVIAAFKAGMPLKRHRRRMQSYVDCFTASEAVTWLHCFLLNNPNFGPNVTRTQTINLLQKFLKCHVIESAIMKSKKKEFLDDSHIYKFNPVSLNQSRPSALCLIQSPTGCKVKSKKNELAEIQNLPKSVQIQKKNIPECHLVERKISPNEIKAIWEKITLSRLESLLPHVSCSELLQNKLIDGHLLKHNASRLSKTGVVVLVDKTDDIPHWVISAMKCLANWPNASGSGSCLPNYPGFEKDVFKVVRDFFINPRMPLLPDFLSSLLIQVFCHFVPREFYDYGDSIRSSSRVFDLSHNLKTSQTSSSQVKTSTPLSNDSMYKSHHLDEIKAARLLGDPNATSHSKNPESPSDGKLLLDDPTVMWEYPSEVYFETDFATTQPITRVISNQCSPRSRSSSFENPMGSIESVSTISVCSQKPYVPSDSKLNSRSPLKAWSSNMYLQDEVKDTPQWMRTASAFSRLSVAECTPLQREKIAESLNCSVSQYPSEPVYMCEINDLNTSDLSSKTITESSENIEYQEATSSRSSTAISSRDFSSPTNQIRIECNSFVEKYGKTFIEDNIYSDDLKSSFQLILLFLPSANRRQLHLLLRLINKILKNGQFVVGSNVNMREYLIETFLPAIVQSDDVPVLCLYQMVAFLLDYCEIVFQPPPGLKEEAIEICKQSSIRFSMDDTCFLTYCEMVSKQQYEEQKKTTSMAALRDLLNNIMSDGKLSERERKRKLKQFKNSHPDIYMLQFPERVEHTAKQKSSFFNKLVNLRM
ncbi:DEP domain-containing protein 1A isoform X1 [Parasteatoda tepidariorum]|uniref:DEP domain-containing protein 1A isoform X1 n=1 Tax=Parasteatoda tepidariorum TaxID=114398 RepID=UPI001C71B03E|nr:DEP domain-containing protein 1B isoform X1 [Parasteatoda tepidariorum]